MVSTLHYLKSNMKLSSVVPATVTGGKVHELTNMDLAMKLHYIKGVYFFKSDAVEGLTVEDLKKPMFPLLQLYFAASGRIRRSGTGRPFINCNDGGVRTVEASCDETIDECLAMAVDQDDSVFDGLVYNQALGDPDLGYTPLVFVQFTRFTCGGISVGLSWANVLGDAFSASAFINLWGKIMAGHLPLESHHMPDPAKSEFPVLVLPKLTPNSLRRVASVGDSWFTPNSCKMKTHTFHVPTEKIDHFLSEKTAKVSAFEVLSAIIWKSLSKIKENPEQTRRVTIVCTNKSLKGINIPSNEMLWSTVEADFIVAEAEVSELVELILNKRADENAMIKEMIGNNESGELSTDFIAYGANLTFVNLEEAEIYGLEFKGKKPVHANYSINGVGEEGVVLVLPAAGTKYGKDGDDVNGDRTVTVVLPENQLAQLKVDLEKNWNIA